jgi:hypothetical protein
MALSRRLALVTVLVTALGACATIQMRADAGSICTTETFTVDDEFIGARRGACAAYSNRTVLLAIAPEDPAPINDSAWFAFRLTPQSPGNATIKLSYTDGHHRYIPKTSTDGIHWTPLLEQAIRRGWWNRSAKFTVPLEGQPVWVAAHELITPAGDQSWLYNLAASSEAEMRLLGPSAAGRPISMLDSGAHNDDLILLVGRQHPPEVSGTFAMKAFIATLYADSALAKAFRHRFAIMAIPMLNPDGVAAGHWRNNLGGKDLNRDWGPFTQPETQLVQSLIDDFVAAGRRIRLFLDFHSTRSNLFYTQADEEQTDPHNFANRWLEAARARLTDYPFSQERRHNEGRPTAKSYMYDRFGIPSITYEVGDEIDRLVAADAAVVFAEEMMRALMENID